MQSLYTIIHAHKSVVLTIALSCPVCILPLSPNCVLQTMSILPTDMLAACPQCPAQQTMGQVNNIIIINKSRRGREFDSNDILLHNPSTPLSLRL